MNQQHLDILKQGVAVWNRFREANPTLQLDLSGALLTNLEAEGVNLSRTDLTRTVLIGANLSKACFQGANLAHTVLINACLGQADFRRTRLLYTSFNSASLNKTDFCEALFHIVDLSHAQLVGTNLRRARLEMVNLEFSSLREVSFAESFINNCLVHGIAATRLDTEGVKQKNLIITNHGDPTVTVDNLKVAQAIFRRVRDCSLTPSETQSLVLILGNFRDARRPILERIRAELKRLNLKPVIFHFDKPVTSRFLEIFRILASMTRFIIAEFTDTQAIPEKVQVLIPTLRIPMQPVLSALRDEWSMFQDFRNCPWILKPYKYLTVEEAIRSTTREIIGPAQIKASEMRMNKVI